ADVDVAVPVALDGMQDVELARVGAARAPGFHPAAVLVDLHDARIAVAVGDVRVAGRVPRDVGRPVERAPAWTRLLTRRQRRGFRLDGFRAAAKHHQDAT